MNIDGVQQKAESCRSSGFRIEALDKVQSAPAEDLLPEQIRTGIVVGYSAPLTTSSSKMIGALTWSASLRRQGA
jgi:hypothetical protein